MRSDLEVITASVDTKLSTLNNELERLYDELHRYIEKRNARSINSTSAEILRVTTEIGSLKPIQSTLHLMLINEMNPPRESNNNIDIIHY